VIGITVLTVLLLVILALSGCVEDETPKSTESSILPPKTTYPNINMQYPPYDRGTQNYYYPEIKGRFNNSQTATWLNITSDATTISFTNVYTDYGIDTDGDGKYNYLAIDVWVNVKEAGY